MIKEQLKLEAEMRKRNWPLLSILHHLPVHTFDRLFCHACSDDDDGNDNLLSLQFLIYSRDAFTAYWSIKR